MKRDTVLYQINDFEPLIFYDANVADFFRGEKVKVEIPIDIVDSETHVGIEVEVEKVGNAEFPSLRPVWNIVADGSLRNKGLEFVSYPIRGEHVHLSLIHLKRILEKYAPNFEFTERTSIHVHVNARMMTIEQLFVFLLVYLTVERSLFRFVENAGFVRDKNIFCAPIQDSQTYLNLAHTFELWTLGKYEQFYNNLTTHWKKYTGMNMLPIRKKGTIEFRHMGGTLDIKLLMDWINLILSIKKYAIKTPAEKVFNYIKELNTNSNYNAFALEVFGKYADLFAEPLFNSRIEEGIIAIKQCLVQSNRSREEKVSLETIKNSSAMKFLMKKGYELAISDMKAMCTRRDELQTKYKQLNDAILLMKGPSTEKKAMKNTLVQVSKELSSITQKIEQLQQLENS